MPGLPNGKVHAYALPGLVRPGRGLTLILRPTRLPMSLSTYLGHYVAMRLPSLGSSLVWFQLGLVPAWPGSSLAWFQLGLVPAWSGSSLAWFQLGLVPAWARPGAGATPSSFFLL